MTAEAGNIARNRWRHFGPIAGSAPDAVVPSIATHETAQRTRRQLPVRRLGRNMRGIVNTLHELTERGVTARLLHDGVDTSTSTGRMVTGILMSIAEYERELVRERTALKLENARKSGRKFGRPARLSVGQAALPNRSEAQRGNRHHLSDARNSPDHLLPLPGRKRRGLKPRCPAVGELPPQAGDWSRGFVESSRLEKTETLPSCGRA